METIIQEILKWPIIIQGALGSGLFWLLLIIGQYLTLKISDAISSYSKKSKKESLLILLYKYSGSRAWFNKDEVLCAAYQNQLFYRSARCLIKGFIWLILGFLFTSFIEIFGFIGFLGGLYYMFKALNYYKPIDLNIDIDSKIIEINNELNALQLNKTNAADTKSRAAD